MYRAVLDDNQKRYVPKWKRRCSLTLTVVKNKISRIFEGVVKYCAAYSNLIPLSFVLGFYVSIVMTRWWQQYSSIPWPDSLGVYVSANVHGQVSIYQLIFERKRFRCFLFAGRERSFDASHNNALRLSMSHHGLNKHFTKSQKTISDVAASVPSRSAGGKWKVCDGNV